MAKQTYDVCVSGSGIVAKAMALALSCDGWRVAWLPGASGDSAVSPRQADVRTYALNGQSMALLSRLRVWDAIATHATPIHNMQILGDGAGKLNFSAWQQCVTELGHIADAAVMEQVLQDALRYAPHVTQVSEAPKGVALHAICEGKHASARAALQADGAVHLDKSIYAHWGVAARLAHDVPHNGVARQWFFSSDTSPDILALLPFDAPEPGHSYGLVWSTPQPQAQALAAMRADEFEQALQKRLASAASNANQPWHTLKLRSHVAAWPLARACAKPWVGAGWALLGDAAHTVHPLSGQGLNLGLADVAALVQVLHDAREQEPWRSVGDERILQRYERARWADTQAMLALTDGLVHLFAPSHPLLSDVRNRGMQAVNELGALKRWLVSRALGKVKPFSG